MNGPQHYAEAERLIGLLHEHAGDEYFGLLGAAQVHATLALAAATAEGHNKISPYRANEWEQATR